MRRKSRFLRKSFSQGDVSDGIDMSKSDDYPSTVAEVLDQRMKFRPAALLAISAFAQTKPWRGTVDERMVKFRELNTKLAAAYGIVVPQLVFGQLDGSDSGRSHYIPALHAIVLRGRLSVVTFLHEFAHARGMNERRACRWSINLFRRCFPRSWSKVCFDDHLVRRQPTCSSPP